MLLAFSKENLYSRLRVDPKLPAIDWTDGFYRTTLSLTIDNETQVEERWKSHQCRTAFKSSPKRGETADLFP